MKETAVEFLQKTLSIHFTFEQKMMFEGLFQQSRKMEKEQIMDAHHCGRAFENKYPDSSKTYNESAEQYYDETFKPKNNESNIFR